jgi:hypothetical protein
MIHPLTTVILSDGEALTAEELFEGLARFAQREASFPLLSSSDQAKAVISVSFEALEWAQSQGYFD